jgi:hypothetical protein
MAAGLGDWCLYQSAETLTHGTGLTPSWCAKARHPCLWVKWQKAWMPTVVGMTGRRPVESRS